MDDPHDASWFEADPEPRMRDSWPRIAVGAAIVLGVTLAAVAALAHQAPTGWRYDGACCNAVQAHGDGRVTGDCQAVPHGVVTIQRDGLTVNIGPGQHARVANGMSRFLPRDSEKIRASGDDEFHVCAIGSVLFCVYVPQGGV